MLKRTETFTMTFNQAALKLTNIDLHKLVWKTVTTNVFLKVKPILKSLKLQIGHLMCSHTISQFCGVGQHFYSLRWVGNLRNSGNRKKVEATGWTRSSPDVASKPRHSVIHFKRDCFGSVHSLWLDTSKKKA